MPYSLLNWANVWNNDTWQAELRLRLVKRSTGGGQSDLDWSLYIDKGKDLQCLLVSSVVKSVDLKL